MSAQQNVEVLWCGNGRGIGWAFPPAVRRRLIQDTEGQSVLHLFGGRSTFGTRMDVDPIVKPDLIGDAWMPPFARDSFDVVVLDPPYIHLNCQAKTALFRAAGWVARRRVVWFSTVWMAASGGLAFEKGWLVRVGDSCHVRALQYFTVTPLEQIAIPQEHARFLTRRTQPFVRQIAAMAQAGTVDLERLARDCYGQGIVDGYQAGERQAEERRRREPS